MPQIANSLTVDNQSMVEGSITGNGRYHAFISNVISTNNNKAVDATLSISELEPNRDGLGKAIVTLVMERQDDGGSWIPIHSLYQGVQAISYSATENGGIIPQQQLSYGPNIYSPDHVQIDASDGINIIFSDHPKQGVLPDKVRFCVVVHERAFGGTGAFDHITFSLDYELRAE